MLRNRDIVAALLALMLTRMSWNDQVENLNASLHLSFYFPFVKDQVAPVPFDVDGDGTPESLVTIRPTRIGRTGGGWIVQLLDLKPLHSNYNSQTALGAPFQPKELLRSEVITAEQIGGIEDNPDRNPAKPLQLVTGQVMVRGISKPLSEQDFDAMNLDERTRHYFCGTDWHDASSKCSTPCPTGTADSCPENERCYADTPCDSSKLGKKDSSDIHEDTYHLTPAGGLPSCFTMWSNGRVTMHSLTSSKMEEEEDNPSIDGGGAQNLTVAAIQAKLKRKIRKQKTPLELVNVWTVNILPDMPSQIQKSTSVQLTFLDTFDAIPEAKHGMLIVSGDLTPDKPTDRPLGSPQLDVTKSPRFVVALDAMTGETLWDSFQNFNEKKEEVLPPLKLERGFTSIARRRSKVAQLDATMTTSTDVEGENNHNGNLPNCLTGYRFSLLGATDALPYAYWGPADAGIRAVHLDHTNTQRKFQRHDQHHAHKHKTALSSSSSSSQNHQPGETSPHHHHHHDHRKLPSKQGSGSAQSWNSALINPRTRKQHGKRHGGHVHFGRPNVIVNYHAGGLHVHSLQNGQPVCHLSLLEEALYVDLQRDGVMDTIQVITNGKGMVMDPMTGTYADPWVAELASRVIKADEAQKEKAKNAAAKSFHPVARLCHALALSGMPAREELFSTPICGTRGNDGFYDNQANNPSMLNQVYAAPPLVVESMYPQHRHKEKDIIFAMSNGVVSRVRGGTGRRQWKLNGKSVENFPTWGGDEVSEIVSMTRLQVDDFAVAPYARPIVLVGESSIAVLSATSASVLAATNIPQRSTRRPILADVSGDGVTDVMIITADAVWGYQILVRTGASIFFRILVGLLLMGILLALLRNQFGGTSLRDRHKRSTDA